MHIEFSEGLSDDARAIRTEVFIEEQGFKDEFDEIDGRSMHIVIYDGGVAAATCRVFQEGGIFHIGRVAVRKPFRGHAYGAAIMDAAEQRVRAMGGTEIAVSAQVRARGFYEKSGYEATGGEYLDEGCPHVKMIKKL